MDQETNHETAPAHRSGLPQVGDIVEYAGRKEEVRGLTIRGPHDGDVLLASGEKVPLSAVTL